MASKMDIVKHADLLKRFVSFGQMHTLSHACYGEEREWFIDTLVELAERILTMPKTYEQDGKGDDAIVYLHYFKGDMDWYITEKDIETEQHQAFGLADLGMGFPELGYISIEELTEYGAELDLHWTPKTLREVKA